MRADLVRLALLVALIVPVWFAPSAPPQAPSAPARVPSALARASAADSPLVAPRRLPGISEMSGALPMTDAVPYKSKTRTDSFTVAATGDVLLHAPLISQARADGHGRLDFYPLLRDVRDVISAADLAICHLETPLAPRGGPFHGYPVFSVPPQVVRAIKRVGYDTCSTASNHTIDQGPRGVRRTLDALDAAGLRHTGSARSPREARKITIYRVKGVKVAHLSYTYGTNGMMEPRGRPWLVNDGIDARAIIRAARGARAGGAEVVIVSLHWGTEYQHAPNAQQRRVATRLLASPAIDLIIGHHAHVVQPFDRIRGKWVAYGLGNQVANPSAGIQATHQGMIAVFRFRRSGDGWVVRPAFLPTRIAAGPPIRLRKSSGLRDVIRVVRALGERVPVLR